MLQVSDDDDSTEPSRLELSFEYLVAKNSLRWITLYTSQVTELLTPQGIGAQLLVLLFQP